MKSKRAGIALYQKLLLGWDYSGINICDVDRIMCGHLRTPCDGPKLY